MRNAQTLLSKCSGITGICSRPIRPAFAMHNVVGGPRFIDQNRDIVYAIILSNFAQAVLLLLVGTAFVYAASTIVRMPLRYLIPCVLVVATMGAYAIEGSSAGPLTLFVFGVLGWLMSRHGYPVAAVVVGLLLGRLIETELLRAWQIAGGNPFEILNHPWALAIVALMLLSLGLSLWQDARRRRLAAA